MLRAAKEAGADAVAKVKVKVTATKRFLPHHKHRPGAGKMLLENYSKGSCVAQFHCRDRHIEKFSLHRRFL